MKYLECIFLSGCGSVSLTTSQSGWFEVDKRLMFCNAGEHHNTPICYVPWLYPKTDIPKN